MSLQAIEPRKLYRQIADQVRQAITRGEHPVGSRLPAERDLAKLMQVSRSSLREALIALEVEGSVEVRTGSGIYVLATAPVAGRTSTNAAAPAPALHVPAHPGPLDWGPLEVMQARRIVESEVAALAAHNARASDLRALGDALAHMQAEADSGRGPRLGDEAFHLALARACGNEVLCDIVARAWQARDGVLFARLGDYFENSESWSLAIDEHALVLQAVRNRDAQAARRAMRNHLNQALKRYSAGWRRAPSR